MNYSITLYTMRMVGRALKLASQDHRTNPTLIGTMAALGDALHRVANDEDERLTKLASDLVRKHFPECE